jgi:hypothetical protein
VGSGSKDDRKNPAGGSELSFDQPRKIWYDSTAVGGEPTVSRFWIVIEN